MLEELNQYTQELCKKYNVTAHITCSQLHKNNVAPQEHEDIEIYNIVTKNFPIPKPIGDSNNSIEELKFNIEENILNNISFIAMSKLFSDLNKMEHYDKLHHFIVASDISDKQVKINGEFQNALYSWGIIRKKNRFIFFITDDEKGYLIYTQTFDDINKACEYVYKNMQTINNAIRY